MKNISFLLIAVFLFSLAPDSFAARKSTKKIKSHTSREMKRKTAKKKMNKTKRTKAVVQSDDL